MKTTDRLLLCSVIAFLPALSGCPAAPTSGLPSRCEAIEVDATRELIITDPSIVGDADVSFAKVMGAVLASPSDASARVWMDAWAAVPGEASIATDVTAAWAASDGEGLDLARAPFELIAIVNRLDFSALGEGHLGEIRFVYGLVTSGTRRPLTINVEIQLPATKTDQEWAAAWHALGTLSGEGERESVMGIVDDVLSEPPHGQVRTQDGRGATPVLLEFDLHPDREALVPSLLVDQPAVDVDSSALASFVSDHEQQVLSGSEVLPVTMLAGSAHAVPSVFTLPGVSPDVATAFTRTTCSGCHTSEPTLDGSFHISPLRRGSDAVSTFLLDPSGGPDELSRRAEVLRGLLCAG